MTPLPWFQPTTIDGTQRRSFFERVPEARPETLGVLIVVHSEVPGMAERLHADLCRAAVDRWARKLPSHVPSGLVVMALNVEDDGCACTYAHRLTDAMGVAP